MSAAYRAVHWNRQKKIYDSILLAGVCLYIAGFIWLTPLWEANTDPMNLRIRAFGSAAFLLLTIILSIGPLCRLNSRFLPLLYNRRHMGVTMCGLALYHAYLVVSWYHGYGNLDPLVSLLVSNTNYGTMFSFPFESLGIGALVILVLMAATSHDFWLANLTAPVWKALHMSVYGAYALLIGHIVLGELQSNSHPLLDDDGWWKISEINAGNIGGLFRLESLGATRIADRFVEKLRVVKAGPKVSQFECG